MGKKEQDSEDLINLSEQKLNENDITAALNDRFSKDECYTRIGQRIVVAVNPNKKIESNSSTVAKQIGNAVKDGQERKAHIYELTASAYYDLVKTKSNQSILFMQVFPIMYSMIVT